MIPIQLTIKGLYSYQSSETIDFKPLVDAGLFGIFGPVGSGKSTILEAIMFVLFDRSNRLNKAGDDRYYNMMNLQSNEMVIDFIFKAGNNHQHKYRFYFRTKRKAKDFSKVDVKDRSYYQWTRNDWVPLKDLEVLGMNYENFMQTVIIPQGKFREFIDQKPAARTEMLKELFHLERFDIAYGTNNLLGSVREKLTYLDGQLSQYAGINQPDLDRLSNEIGDLDKQKTILSEKEIKLAAEVAELDALQQLFNELKEAGSLLESLSKETSFYQQKEHQLARYEKSSNLFREKIHQQQQYLQELRSKRDSLRLLLQSIQEIEVRMGSARKQWQDATSNYACKDKWRIQSDELGILLDLKTQQEKFEKTNVRWEAAQKEVQHLENSEKKIVEMVNQAKSMIKGLSEVQEEHQKLLLQEQWWDRHKEWDEQLLAHQEEKNRIKAEVKTLNEQKKIALTKIGRQKDLENKIEHNQQILRELQLQEDWSEHARHLSDGTPCPLCGALHHPKVLSKKDLSKTLQTARKRLQDLKAEEMAVRELLQETRVVETTIVHKATRANEITKMITDIRNKLQQHRNKYPGNGAPPTPPNDLKLMIRRVQEKVATQEKAQNNLHHNSLKLEQLTGELKSKRSILQHIALEKEKLKGEMDQSKKLIKSLEVKNYINRSPSDLKAIILKLDQQSRQAEAEYQKSMEQLSHCEQELNRQQGRLQSVEDQVGELENKTRQLETELLRLCKKEGFKGLHEVQKVLGLDLDVDDERRTIQRYREQLKLQENNFLAIRKKVGNKSYEESQHLAGTEQLESLRENLERLRHQLSGKQHAFDAQRMQLQKKKSLVEQIDALSERKGYLQEIGNLLRGNGFINYISSVYLHNLCKIANQRFSKLTGNRLSLELNEQNDFMVRDYLNEGKLRLLKTLSGGQIFQASLCLALALAENVKTLNQADQSFFFLDEGFGALDKASIQIVFDTLKSLQKENRIVGIISHVEELQQEIDIYLSIQQRGEKGSKVTKSWELVS